MCVVLWCHMQSLINTAFQDTRLKGIRGLNLAFIRSPPLLTDQSLSHAPAEHSLKIDRRNTDLDSKYLQTQLKKM